MARSRCSVTSTHCTYTMLGSESGRTSTWKIRIAWLASVGSLQTCCWLPGSPPRAPDSNRQILELASESFDHNVRSAMRLPVAPPCWLLLAIITQSFSSMMAVHPREPCSAAPSNASRRTRSLSRRAVRSPFAINNDNNSRPPSDSAAKTMRRKPSGDPKSTPRLTMRSNSVAFSEKVLTAWLAVVSAGSADRLETDPGFGAVLSQLAEVLHSAVSPSGARA
ncbi:unannotated protein [freshwater metagenome]|uniref:Unannotated protein n=1 Tax=freshwater metagenome TaxID=449393 RepID=A0A6J7NCR6_9ZZZZ